METIVYQGKHGATTLSSDPQKDAIAYAVRLAWSGRDYSFVVNDDKSVTVVSAMSLTFIKGA